MGVTKEDAALGKVIDVCLEEIENSQPFFIGIVGSHYGSTIEINDPIRISNLKERWGGDWIETAIKKWTQYHRNRNAVRSPP